MGYFDHVTKERKAPPVRATEVQPLVNRDGITPYAASAIAQEIARLQECSMLGWNGPPWDTTTFEVACNLIEFANSPWAGYSLTHAEADFYSNAPSDENFGRRKHEEKWRSAQTRVGTLGRTEPTRDEAPAVTVLERPSVAQESDNQEPSPDESEGPKLRRVVLTPASSIKPLPVWWLWKKRIALGTLSLIAGREGLGKSTLAYWIASRITRGELFGEYQGEPRGVLVCATEDSWEHTIVPRLMAAGADLDRVFRVDVLTHDDLQLSLSLPRDLVAVEEAAKQVGAALLLLDPLMSRLGDLDTHRDAEVRQALEPLAALADRCGMAVLGLIHHNKSGSSDPLQLVMGSKAFSAVARSVHTVIPDPDDADGLRRLFGTSKNNLGPTDLPTFTFTIESHRIATDQGDAWTGMLQWGDELDEGIEAVMARATDEEGGSTTECADWLKAYLESQGGTAERASVIKAGKVQEFAERTIGSARKKLGIKHKRQGFPGTTYWSLPGTLPTLDADGAS